MLKVRINRANWACGGRYAKHAPRSYTGNLLYNEDTKGMCCLGFATNQLCDIPIENLNNNSFPSYLGFMHSADVAKRFGFNSLSVFRHFENQAVRINDNAKLSYARREKRILKLFKDYDIDVEFYGKYTK